MQVAAHLRNIAGHLGFRPNQVAHFILGDDLWSGGGVHLTHWPLVLPPWCFPDEPRIATIVGPRQYNRIHHELALGTPSNPADWVGRKARLSIRVVERADKRTVFFRTSTSAICTPSRFIRTNAPRVRLPFTKPVPFLVWIRSNLRSPNSFPVGMRFSLLAPLVCW